MTTPTLREAAQAVMDIYDSKYPYGYNVTMIWADLRAALAQPGEELWHQCPDCKNHFLQPFVCTTCGAQKLYDTTVFSQQQVLDAQAARIERLEAALEAWVDTDKFMVFTEAGERQFALARRLTEEARRDR